MSADLDPAVVPADLRAARRWVTWRDVGGKKLPSGRNGADGWQLPESWMTFEEAVGRGPNVGFVLGDGFTGLDLDDCRDPGSGKVHPLAEDVVLEHAAGCYAEVSPSGTGLKVFGRADIPGVELKFNGDGSPKVTKTFAPGGSYFTVTGDCVNTEGLGDLTRALEVASMMWGGGGGEGRERPGPLPGVVAEHARNETLTREAGRLRRLGFDEAEILAALRAVNERRCRPPLDEREVESVARSIAKKTPAADAFPTTEAGDAEFFAACNADLVRYDHRRGLWLLYDVHRWEPQSDGEVHRLALDAVRARQRAAVGNKERLRWAAAGESHKRLSNLLALARSVKPVADAGEGWDTDPWLLGVRNGVVDLRTGGLRPGRPEDRIAMAAAAAFDPAAECPLWDRTLADVFDGDEELVAYFDRFVGYSLTGDCREEVLALCWGGGANGKGTVMNTVARVLGDYADDLPFSALELRERAGIPNDVAKVVGKRFVTASESGEARRLNEARVKALTGRDPITARFLHHEFFTFQPVAKFWLATNHRPVVRDTSVGFWRRVHLIPFTRSFADRPDLTLKDKLRDEAAGILARAVRGCLAWQRDGLKPPAAVVAATESYRAESHPLAQFLDERCVVRDGARETFGKLFDEYKWWHERERTREARLGRHEFNSALRERFRAEVRDRKTWFVGVGIAEGTPDVVGEERDLFGRVK